jgi:hypothetical protein
MAGTKRKRDGEGGRQWERLTARIEAWKAIGAPPRVINWIRDGVPLAFRDRPPRRFDEGESLRRATEDQREFVRRELPRLEALGAIERDHGETWGVSRMFLVEKGETSWRVVIDLRHLNESIRDERLELGGLRRVPMVATREGWAITFDVSDGFYLLRLKAEHRKWCQFRYEGNLYRLVGLPMGYKNSPATFCALMNAWTRWLVNPRATMGYEEKPGEVAGMPLIAYMDDLAAFAATREEVLAHRQRIADSMARLGIPRHPSKGDWEPTQCFRFLGLEVDLQKGKFVAPIEKLQKLKGLAAQILGEVRQRQGVVPIRLLAKMTGVGNFVGLAIPEARHHLRSIYDLIGSGEAVIDWRRSVRITNQVRKDLSWWSRLEVDPRSNGAYIWPPPTTATMYVDSSLYAWGAGLVIGEQRFEAQGRWATPAHISLLELKTVRRALESFGALVKGHRLKLWEDNQTALALLRSGTSKIPAMMNELRELRRTMREMSVEIDVAWIPSAENHWADAMSRETPRGEWSLSRGTFRELQVLFGCHCTVDRFATRENAQLPRFNSRRCEAGSEQVDAFAVPDSSWRSEINFCHPPWSELDRLALKLETSRAEALVILPGWRTRDFFRKFIQWADAIREFKPSQAVFWRDGELETTRGYSTYAVHIPRR